MYRLYGTRRWRNRRAHQLRIEPLCRMCAAEGKVVAARVADHIHGWNNVNEFWLGPLQSLCTSCHSGRKQSIDRLGFDKTVDTSGWPIDKNHPVYTGVVE